MWQIMLTIAILFLLLEVFMPALFFLNLAVAAFFCAVIAFFVINLKIIIMAFVLLSLAALLCLRPILIKSRDDKLTRTGFQDKYIGKTVKVIKQVDKFSGAITIYDERWEARALNDEVIPEGSNVKIVKNESLIMFVERVV